MRKHLTTISDKYVHEVRFRDYQLNEKQTEEYTDPAEWSCPLFIQTYRKSFVPHKQDLYANSIPETGNELREKQIEIHELIFTI